MLDTIVELLTLAASVATIAGVVFAVRIYRRQMNAQIFMTYTQRYEAIMACFPEGARSARFGDLTELPPSSPALNLAILRYLNLCSEEFYLCATGHLDRKLWEIWEHELKRMLQSALVRREWSTLRCEFVSYPEFLEFVEAVQAAPAETGTSTGTRVRAPSKIFGIRKSEQLVEPR